jgi:hypothetical protein
MPNLSRNISLLTVGWRGNGSANPNSPGHHLVAVVGRPDIELVFVETVRQIQPVTFSTPSPSAVARSIWWSRSFIKI